MAEHRLCPQNKIPQKAVKKLEMFEPAQPVSLQVLGFLGYFFNAAKRSFDGCLRQTHRL